MKKILLTFLLTIFLLLNINAASDTSNLNINIDPNLNIMATIVSKDTSIPTSFKDKINLIKKGSDKAYSNDKTIHFYDVGKPSTTKKEVANVLTFFYPGKENKNVSIKLTYDGLFKRENDPTTFFNYKLYYGNNGSNEVISNVNNNNFIYTWDKTKRVKVTPIYYKALDDTQLSALPGGKYIAKVKLTIVIN